MNRKARRRLANATTGLVTLQPFFGVPALSLEKKEDSSKKTIASDGITMFYNPEWVLSPETSMDELRLAIAHVVMARALEHNFRREDREYVKWQHASHKVCLKYLHAAGLTADDDFLDMSVEEAYKILPDPTEGDGDGDGNNQGAGMGIAAGGGQPPPPGQGEDDQDGQGQQPPPNYTPPKGAGEVLDTKAPEGMSKAEQEEWEAKLRQEWGDQAAQAEHLQRVQSQQSGDVSGNLLELVNAGRFKRVNYRVLLRRFMEERAKEDYSWQNPNLRLMHLGIITPGLSGEGMGAIVLAIDTSGSMDRKTLAACWTEIREAAQELLPRCVYVIQADVDVQRVDVFNDPLNLPFEFPIKGGGGTSFRDVFRYVAEELPEKPACLLYYTDLWVYEDDYPDETPEVPTLWLHQGDGGNTNVPFGEVVEVGEVD